MSGEVVRHEEPSLEDWLEKLLQEAIDKRVSDIHLESHGEEGWIRLRIDGFLHAAQRVSLARLRRLISRIKLLSALDIAEQRLPQDGHFRSTLSGRSLIDIRVSTCPMWGGEKAVLRLFNPDQSWEIDQLGFTEDQRVLLLRVLAASRGLVVVTGPTGSGKTSTLYAALRFLRAPSRNLITLEDPVETVIPGVNQVQIHRKLGMTFREALRVILRQDPDVLMLGEIRDSETAEIAIATAQTGRLVLSTLHTGDVLEAFARLHYLGVPLYDLMETISCITSQRLLRKACSHCGGAQSQGCSVCQKGYWGRLGVHEVLFLPSNRSKPDLDYRSLPACVEEIALHRGKTLFEVAQTRVARGETTREEVNRVLG